jgi:hypothetical protein
MPAAGNWTGYATNPPVGQGPLVNFRERRLGEVQLRRTPLPRTPVNKPPVEPVLRWFIQDSSLRVPLPGVSSARLDYASPKASDHQGRRKRIVFSLLAQGSVVVLLMAFGWWGITTLGSDSLRAMRGPIYVAGCPLSNTLENSPRGGGCSQEGASHPITSRQPGAGLASEHAHGAEK